MQAQDEVAQPTTLRDVQAERLMRYSAPKHYVFDIHGRARRQQPKRWTRGGLRKQNARAARAVRIEQNSRSKNTRFTVG